MIKRLALAAEIDFLQMYVKIKYFHCEIYNWKQETHLNYKLEFPHPKYVWHQKNYRLVFLPCLVRSIAHAYKIKYVNPKKKTNLTFKWWEERIWWKWGVRKWRHLYNLCTYWSNRMSGDKLVLHLQPLRHSATSHFNHAIMCVQL